LHKDIIPHNKFLLDNSGDEIGSVVAVSTNTKVFFVLDNSLNFHFYNDLSLDSPNPILFLITAIFSPQHNTLLSTDIQSLVCLGLSYEIMIELINKEED